MSHLIPSPPCGPGLGNTILIGQRDCCTCPVLGRSQYVQSSVQNYMLSFTNKNIK